MAKNNSWNYNKKTFSENSLTRKKGKTFEQIFRMSKKQMFQAYLNFEWKKKFELLSVENMKAQFTQLSH